MSIAGTTRTGSTSERAGLRVVAIVESDAYLKWAASLLDRAPASWNTSVVSVAYPSSPTPRQVVEALAGTAIGRRDIGVASVLELRRHLRAVMPDVVILACTGPLVSMLDRAVVGSLERRPVVVAALPGLALPVRRPAVEMRRGVDVFVAHSHVERDRFRAAFAAIGASTEVALARLPFLADADRMAPPHVGRPDAERVVFAAQARVPRAAQQRSILLQRLATRSPSRPLVKLRSEEGESTTHREPFPYPEVAELLVDDGVLALDAVEFGYGPMADAIATAGCLLTVSSTAALEAAAAGVPIGLVADFGVSSAMLNEVFVGSGCLVDLSSAPTVTGHHPDPGWAHRNYLHDRGDDDWIERIESRIGRSSTRARRHERRDARATATATKALVRSVVSAAAARRSSLAS